MHEHLINLQLESGHILTNITTGETVFRQVTTEPWDWKDVLSRPLRRVSPEEYQELVESKNHVSLLQGNINVDQQRYWKVMITKTDDEPDNPTREPGGHPDGS